MSYAWMNEGGWQEGYAPPPEMPPPEDRGYAPPPEMPPPEDRGYGPPPQMPPPKPSDLPYKPKPEEGGMGIGWHALIVLGGFAYLGYYYFRRR